MIQFFSFFTGSIFAFFLSLVIDRFPEQAVFTPCSFCNHCGHRLALRDLIPIVSALLNKLNCRFCGKRIPLHYLILELISGCLFLAFSLSILSISQLLLLMMGLTLAVYDQREQAYPFSVWLVFQFFLFWLNGFNPLMAFFLLLGFLAACFDLKIGAGDFLFLASCSALFTLTEILIIIQISSLAGLLCFCFKQKKDSLPFVPCLLFGVAVLISYKLLLFG